MTKKTRWWLSATIYILFTFIYYIIIYFDYTERSDIIMSNLSIPSSMTEQIEQIKGLEISYRVLHPSAKINDKNNKRYVNFPFSSIINKYKDFLYSFIITIALTEEEQNYYQYKPKMLSEDLYGTTELWDAILLLNNNVSVSEFKPKKLKLYDPAKFKRYLNEIMLLEEELGNITY